MIRIEESLTDSLIAKHRTLVHIHSSSQLSYLACMHLISSELINFYSSLRIGCELPEGVELLHPQANEAVMKAVSDFLNRYYSDQYPRQLLFGINPGRFGAGTTGINFTG